MALQRAAATTKITSEASTATVLILMYVSIKIYMDWTLWQVNDFLNTSTKAIPTVLTFFKNSILNQSEELCRKDKIISGMN